MMNRWIGKGNLGRDPELSYTPSGVPVCKFSIAVAHPYHPKDKDKTFWANCVAWKKTAEAIAQYLKKGQQILVEGYVEEQKWEKDGVKRSSIQITVERFEFCGSSQSSGSSSAGAYTPPGGDDDIPF
jgi:single-strand DNA-binding protein